MTANAVASPAPATELSSDQAEYLERAMSDFHEAARTILAAADESAAFAALLDAVIRVQGAAMGNVQVLNAASRTLDIVAQRGFPPELLEPYRSIDASDDQTVCGRALGAGSQVVVEDVMVDPGYAPHRPLAVAAGFRGVVSSPLVTPEGQLLGIVSTHFRDPHRPSEAALKLTDLHVRYAAQIITRCRASEALRESDQKLRVALGAAELGAWAYFFDDSRWELDERAQALYQVDGPVVCHDEVMMRRIMHPDDIPVMWECVQKACDPGGNCRYACEYRIRQPDGGYRWVRAWAQVMFEGEGAARRAVRMIGSSRAITESKRREEAMRQAKEEAERASEAKSAFLATLSHELRTPLTPVLLTTSLMESHPGLPPELREDVATIRRNVELESRLISDLLDLTRIERGKLELDERETDLHLIVRSAADICQREASAKLTLDLRATQHTVRGDATRLQQVFWNLINNAIKFTPPDGTIVVRSADAGDGRVRVEVSDTGAGIDPAMLPRLFNAFEQGDVRAGRQHAGLGLGLAISKRLAEAHRGTIAAASAGRGRGATFTVELPAAEVFARAAAAPDRPAGARVAARPLNVLLVEDHEPTLRVMERLLRRIGHRVTGVTSVASATSVARQDGFDLLISDLGLPDGSGLDIMRELRDRYSGRAIALTGYGMDSDIAASRDAGFTEHLTKPVDLAALEAAIGRATAAVG